VRQDDRLLLRLNHTPMCPHHSFINKPNLAKLREVFGKK
jgi:hypothetical protein